MLKVTQDKLAEKARECAYLTEELQMMKAKQASSHGFGFVEELEMEKAKQASDFAIELDTQKKRLEQIIYMQNQKISSYNQTTDS